MYNYTVPSTCHAGPLGPSLADLCSSSKAVLFMTLLNGLTGFDDKISGRCERVESIKTPDEVYDFVVVGGGGAGAVVAGRLSENPDWNVLVLEAGPDEPMAGGIPLFVDKLVGSAEIDWNYKSTNESHACLSTNGSCSLSAGKMLGGGTSHYGMTYIRGNPTDYNNWAALGNEGWTWGEVEPFFITSEDNGEIKRVGRKHHGTGGPISVERFPHVPPFGISILEAAEEAGYTVSDDLNGDKFTGFSRVQTTSKNGVRRSSASAYLRPVRSRKNLHISLKSHATRLIIEDDKAVGVKYYQNGKPKTVRASREVVLSAGTIMSPQILLLSGVGPREHLESAGVKVVKDLPGVGENLHDHISFDLDFTIDEPDLYDNDRNIAAQYLTNQTGPLSSNGLAQIMGTLKTKAASADYPDLQVYFNGYNAVCAPGRISALHSAGKRTVKMRAVNLRPKSRGRVSLASNNALENPVIWFNYLGEPEDIDGLVEAIELALGMADTRAMKNHGLTLSTTPIEVCSNHTFPSTEYWRCAVRQDASPELHQAGTCKMGPSSDPMAVVDHQLRVHGIRGLRIVDNSIMPRVTSGNTGGPAMMIGERAANFIKKTWAQ